MPLGPDDEFNCPESHLDFIRKRLVATDGLHILSIGYSGLDSGLLQLLASSGNSIRSLFAVNHEGVSALEAATRIATAFLDVAHPDMAYAGTFESFTQSGGLEEYLTTLALAAGQGASRRGTPSAGASPGRAYACCSSVVSCSTPAPWRSAASSTV